MTALGLHLLVDLHECDRAALDDVAAVRAALLEAVRLAEATVVAECSHHFSPHGVTGVVVIAESHVALHTWPEHGFAALDLFLCGSSLKSDPCIAYLVSALGCRRHDVRRLERGHGPPP